MDSHLLFELTYMLYKIHSTIIHGEHWLMETSRKFCLFYPPCKGWFRNLAQGLLHNISSYSLARRAPTFSFVKVLFLTRERLAWWSSRPLSVDSIFFVVGRNIRAGRGSLLLCLTELRHHQSLVAWLFHHLTHELHDLFFETRFHQCGLYAYCLLDSFPDPFHDQDWEIRLVDERWQIPPDADLIDVDLILP